MRTLLLLALLAAPLLARPPVVSQVLLMNDLEDKLMELHEKLRSSEAFANKVPQERMILRFQAGAKEFAGRKLNGQSLVKALLEDWKAIQKPMAQCDPEQIRVLEMLAAALEARYKVPPPIPKKERYLAAKVLVKALKSKYDIVRKTAIDGLEKVYGKTLLYRYDATPAQRNERYRKWLREIEKLRR